MVSLVTLRNYYQRSNIHTTSMVVVKPFDASVQLSPSSSVVNENLRVVGLVIYSVIMFIFSFATASAWVATATQAIRFRAHARYGTYVASKDFSVTSPAASGNGHMNYNAQKTITNIAFLFTGILTAVTLGLAIGFAFASKTERVVDVSGSTASLIQNIYKHVENSEKSKISNSAKTLEALVNPSEREDQSFKQSSLPFA